MFVMSLQAMKSVTCSVVVRSTCSYIHSSLANCNVINECYALSSNGMFAVVLTLLAHVLTGAIVHKQVVSVWDYDSFLAYIKCVSTCVEPLV